VGEILTCEPTFDRIRVACTKIAHDGMPPNASNDARLALEACLHADLERHFADLGVGKRLPNKDLLLLVVWCLIAGFSERFVPNLLAKNEQKAAGTSAT
jgi:hypothetical protein